jgi:hypothetical protein
MEWKYIIVDPEQNTKENGYGKDNTTNAANRLKVWSKFYDVDHFPLYSDIKEDKRYKLIPDVNLFFDTFLFKKRIEINAKVFLREADNRAKILKKRAFCHIVGLGLGDWAIHPIQNQLTIEVYYNLLRNNNYYNISNVYFAWITPTQIPFYNGHIKIEYGKRDPFGPLENGKFIVANFDWNGNSYIGNEYWLGNLNSSGSSAAVCCSLIGHLGNPDVNTANINQNNVKFI